MGTGAIDFAFGTRRWDSDERRVFGEARDVMARTKVLRFAMAIIVLVDDASCSTSFVVQFR